MQEPCSLLTCCCWHCIHQRWDVCTEGCASMCVTAADCCCAPGRLSFAHIQCAAPKEMPLHTGLHCPTLAVSVSPVAHALHSCSIGTVCPCTNCWACWRAASLQLEAESALATPGGSSAARERSEAVGISSAPRVQVPHSPTAQRAASAHLQIKGLRAEFNFPSHQVKESMHRLSIKPCDQKMQCCHLTAVRVNWGRAKSLCPLYPPGQTCKDITH